MSASELLGDLYESEPPTVNECELFYVHADERDGSVTLGFDTRELPSRPRAEWREKTYNRFEFHLLFSDVTEFQVHGWGPQEAREVDISAAPGKKIKVALGRTGSGIHFLASSMRLASARVYLASDAP
ncbi:Imm50 family immunity protein [Streptomyces sp. NPDC048297]|uniref:Imm50 family immunity protein n=1 Tax=Streptomyces sp. NPDC048297 TaxID=3365531 RepID=UPI0037148DB0